MCGVQVRQQFNQCACVCGKSASVSQLIISTSIRITVLLVTNFLLLNGGVLLLYNKQPPCAGKMKGIGLCFK